METSGQCETIVHFCCYKATKQNSIYTNDYVFGLVASAIRDMYLFHAFSQCLGCLWLKQHLCCGNDTIQPVLSLLYFSFFFFFFNFNDMSHSLTAQIEFPNFFGWERLGNKAKKTL